MPLSISLSMECGAPQDVSSYAGAGNHPSTVHSSYLPNHTAQSLHGVKSGVGSSYTGRPPGILESSTSYPYIPHTTNGVPRASDGITVPNASVSMSLKAGHTMSSLRSLLYSSTSPVILPTFISKMPDALQGPFLSGGHWYPCPDMTLVLPSHFVDDVLGGALSTQPAQAVASTATVDTGSGEGLATMSLPAVVSSATRPKCQLCGVEHKYLVDRGANVSIWSGTDGERYAEAVIPVDVPIGGQGKGQSTHCKRAFAMTPILPNGRSLAFDVILESPRSRANIIDEGWLWRRHRAYVDTPSSTLVFADGGHRVPLHKAKDGRLWLTLVHPVINDHIPPIGPEVELPVFVHEPRHSEAVCQAALAMCLDSEGCLPCDFDEGYMASAAYSPHMIDDDKSILDAARFGTSASGLRALNDVCDGLKSKPSSKASLLIDGDKYRMESIAKRESARKISIPKPNVAGDTLVFDGQGPSSTQSVYKNHTYMLGCIVRPSKFGIRVGTRSHTQPVWRAFIIRCVVLVRAAGRTVCYLRFDRAGEFSPEFIDDIEQTLKVIVQMAPAKWHEGVGDAEIANDILTRMGEAMVRRAGLGPAYFILACCYAQLLLNYRALRGMKISRFEALTGLRPALNEMPNYVFGTRVAVLREKGERGPPGSIDNGRTYEGRLVGIQENSYMVIKDGTGIMVFPSKVHPLDEAALVRRGLPPSLTLRNQMSQTDPTDMRDATRSAIVLSSTPSPSSAPLVSAWNGDGATIMYALMGHESVPDNVQSRVHARFPKLHMAANVDAKNDPHGQDLTERSVRIEFLARIAKGDVNVVVMSTVCGTFGPMGALQKPPIQYRSKTKCKHGLDQVLGCRDLPKAAKVKLDRANIIAHFVCTALEACRKHGVEYIVDCSPDMAEERCVDGKMVPNPARWPEYEDCGSFWDLPRVKQLLGGKRYLAAMCSPPMNKPYRKYVEVMVSPGLVPAADRLLSPLACTHSVHPMRAIGRDAAGNSMARQTEEFPKEFADILAQVATHHLLPQGVLPPPCPPFSNLPRSSVEPAYPHRPQVHVAESFERRVGLLGMSGLDAIDDAYVEADDDLSIEYDLTLDCFATELDVQPRQSILTSVDELISVNTIESEMPSFIASFQRDDLGNLIDMPWLHHQSQVYCTPGARAQPMVMKAAAKAVDVVTDLGVQVRRVPQTLKQLMAAPDKEEWLESDWRAHIAVIAGGNVLTRIDSVPQGVPIAPCVTQRRYKIDQSTGRLETKNGGVKSRHCVNGARLAAFREHLGLPPANSGQSNIVDDLVLKMFLADAAGRRRHLTKADIGNAYAKGVRSRDPGYMYMAKSIEQHDDDGTLMVYKLYTPLWGETEAGFEWDIELHRSLTSMGWKQCEGIPAMYWYEDESGSDARVVKIVDDLLFSESGELTPITTATIRHFEKEYKGDVTHEYEPESFAGFKIQRSKDLSRLHLSQPQKVLEAVKAHMPELLDGDVPDRLLRGKALSDELDRLQLPPPSDVKTPKGGPLLSADGKRFQRIVGSCKFFERGVMVRLSRMMHSLSCVMSNPPEQGSEYGNGLLCAESVLWCAYRHYKEGISYGRRAINPRRDVVDGKLDMQLDEGAPNEFEVSADSSHGQKNVYGVLATFLGGAVMQLAKKGGAVSSTMEGEQVATVKGSEICVYGTLIQIALGVPSVSIVRLITDNLSNMRVATNSGSSARSRHFLIRYECLKTRQANGECDVLFTHDPSMPTDSLTKWVSAVKASASIGDAKGERPS